MPVRERAIRLAVCLCSLVAMASADAAEMDNAQTAGQLQSKQANACKHLKGAALEQCLNGYVGPEEGSRYGRDGGYAGGKSTSKPKFKTRGEWTRPGRY
jgi:hypothetical protein